MVIEHISPDDFPAHDNLFQTSFWGGFKTSGGNTAGFFLCTMDDMQFPLMVLLRTASESFTYAYVPRGPFVDVETDQYGFVLEDIALSIKPLLPPSVMFIRFDTAWRTPFSHTKLYDAPPRAEIREMRMNFGTQHRSLRKSVTDHLCPDTTIINLKPTPLQILSNMRQTTRNSIKRAYKSGVTFQERSADYLPLWFDLYQDTARRKLFFQEKLDYFQRLFYVHETKPYVNAAEESFTSVENVLPIKAPVPSPHFHLLTAEKDDKMISGLILGICGRSAYYMYAGSSETDRKYMPNYGLQWEAILFARQSGCTHYDLLGIPPNNNADHPMSGLFIFKTGFGGDRVRFCGSWDFPYNTEDYNWFRNSENLSC